MKRTLLLIAAIALGICACAPKSSDKQSEELFTETQVETENQMEDLNVQLLSDETVDGVRTIRVRPSGVVCSREISFSVKDGLIVDAAFVGGCPGNALGIVSLIKGMTIAEAITRLEGIECASRPTSCPDQLSRAMKLSLQTAN